MRFDAAERLLERYRNDNFDPGCISGQDGYYFAALVDAGSRVVLGTDVLGMFPLYYWAQGEVFLFGTSPELFRAHPHFRAEPCLYGVASILLVNHITGGRSLYKDVFRSTPGKYLSWSANAGVTEHAGNPLLMSDRGFGLSYESTKSRVAETLNAFHQKLSALSDLKVFLSGGQDSRLVAGYVDKHIHRDGVEAISLGARGDQELAYARMVSRRLGWKHRYADVEPDQYPVFASRQLRLESLQGPFASFDTSTAQKLFSSTSGPFISGYFGDLVIGDRHINTSLDPATGEFSFVTLLKRLGAYGFPVDDTVELLSTGFGNERKFAGEVIDNLHESWTAIDGYNFQKAWLFQALNRQRFHIGSIAWRLSLGAWHINPYLARPLLETVSQMPLSYFSSRRVQAELIKTEFPALATIPLDRNSGQPDYLVRTATRRFLDGLPTLSDLSWRLHRAVEQRRERRYYFRTYDFNGPGWRSIRRAADPLRAQASTLLNPDALARLLPPADSNPKFKDGIIDSSKTKTLTGLVLWNGLEHMKP